MGPYFEIKALYRNICCLLLLLYYVERTERKISPLFDEWVTEYCLISVVVHLLLVLLFEILD